MFALRKAMKMTRPISVQTFYFAKASKKPAKPVTVSTDEELLTSTNGKFDQLQEMWVEDIEANEISKLLGGDFVKPKTPKYEESALTRIDLYDVEFQNELREFCHFYQIPFQESNIPGTAKNAAKIYYRIVQDGEQLSKHFLNSPIMAFFKQVKAKDIDDSFNPYNLKEKWLKFFRTGLSRIEYDNDRVLKNKINDTVAEFIEDELSSFSDTQLIRTLLVTNDSTKIGVVKLKDRAIQNLQNNISQGKFSFRNGSALPAFAQAFNIINQQLFYTAEDLPLQSVLGEQMATCRQPQPLSYGTMFSLPLYHIRMLRCTHAFTPFLQEYFKSYQLNQKLVVLRMYQRLSIYDENIYSNFKTDLEASFLQAKNPDAYLTEICVTQNPISGKDIDRTFELLDVLEFQAAQTNEPFVLSDKVKQAIAHYVLRKLEKNPDILTKMDYKYPMFVGAWPHVFLTSDNKDNDVEFYNQLLDLMYKQCSDLPDKESVYPILQKLEKITKHESNLNQAKLTRLVALCQDRLLAQFEVVENMLVKEMLLLSTSALKGGYDQSKNVCDLIVGFRSSLLKLLKIKSTLVVGDQQQLDYILDKSIYLFKLNQEFINQLDSVDREQPRFTTFDHDLIRLAAYADVQTDCYMRRLLNECYIDQLCLEMLQRRAVQASILIEKEDKFSGSVGLLKRDNSQSKYSVQPSSGAQQSQFFNDSSYQRGVDIFEKQFDNQLTLLNNQSQGLRMDNATFLRIQNTTRQSKFEDVTITEIFRSSERMRVLQMPFYKDNMTIAGVNEGLKDANSYRFGAALASYAINLHKMVRHALQQHKQHSLSQQALDHLIEALNNIEPEKLTVLLAQDLDFFRDMQELNYRLLDSNCATQVNQVDWAQFKIDPSDFIYDDNPSPTHYCLQNLAKFNLVGVDLKPHLDKISKVQNELIEQLCQEKEPVKLQTSSLDDVVGGHLKYIESLINRAVHSKFDQKELSKSLYKHQLASQLDNINIAKLVSKDYSDQSNWLQINCRESKEFDIKQFNYVLLLSPIVSQFVTNLEQRRNRPAVSKQQFLREQHFQKFDPIQKKVVRNFVLFPYVFDYVLYDDLNNQASAVADTYCEAKKAEEFGMELEPEPQEVSFKINGESCVYSNI